jgi:hypothetical protein
MGQQKCEKHLTTNGASTLIGVMLAHLSDYLHIIFLKYFKNISFECWKKSNLT